MHEASPQDINAGIARQAYAGISFSPDQRGEQVRVEYAHTFNHWAERMRQRDPQDGTRDDLEAVIGETLTRYRAAYTAWLHAQGRCISPMITGPANFPVRRNEKANQAERNAYDCIGEALRKAERRIRRRFFPLDAGISSDRDDAADLLRQKLEGLEANQAMMKRVNAAHRKFKKNPDSLEKADLSEKEKEVIRTYQPRYSWEPHPFPPYALTNNNANIKRVRDRIKQVESRAGQTTQVAEVPGGITIIDNVEANRLQIAFPGKPDAEVRKLLKRHGFKWAPSAGVWQRMRGSSAIDALDAIGLGNYTMKEATA